MMEYRAAMTIFFPSPFLSIYFMFCIKFWQANYRMYNIGYWGERMFIDLSLPLIFQSLMNL